MIQQQLGLITLDRLHWSNDTVCTDWYDTLAKI